MEHIAGANDRAKFPLGDLVEGVEQDPQLRPELAVRARSVCGPEAGPCFDAFVAKLNPAGRLVFATFHGGDDLEMGSDMICLSTLLI